MSHNGKSRISTESEEAIHAVWSYIGFCAETTIFILAGLWLAQIVLASFTWLDLGKSFALYGFLLLIRYLALMLFLPCMSRSGYVIKPKSVILLAYSGLRGAICLCLALLVKKSDVDKRTSDMIMFHTALTVLLTLLINGTTTGQLIKLLNLQQTTII